MIRKRSKPKETVLMGSGYPVVVRMDAHRTVPRRGQQSQASPTDRQTSTADGVKKKQKKIINMNITDTLQFEEYEFLIPPTEHSKSRYNKSYTHFDGLRLVNDVSWHQHTGR